MRKKKTERIAAATVLVGTYRPECRSWIVGRKLYNLPLPAAGAGAAHAVSNNWRDKNNKSLMDDFNCANKATTRRAA